MSASGIFKPGTLTFGRDVWDLTWKTIDTFCPSLKEDVLAKVDPRLKSPAQTPSPLPQHSEVEITSSIHLTTTPESASLLPHESTRRAEQLLLNLTTPIFSASSVPICSPTNDNYTNDYNNYSVDNNYNTNGNTYNIYESIDNFNSTPPKINVVSLSSSPSTPPHFPADLFLSSPALLSDAQLRLDI